MPDEAAWVDLSGAWDDLRRVADEFDRWSSSASNTRVWNPDHNFVGQLGQHVYAAVAGIEWDARDALRQAGAQGRLGDGGEDFPGVDVKAVVREPPLLMRLATDRFKAPYYALVLIDQDGRRGRYVGYATWQMLTTAPLREFGYGPTRTVAATALIPGLPGTGQAGWAGFVPAGAPVPWLPDVRKAIDLGRAAAAVST